MAKGKATEETKTRVFISYSRKDAEFAEKLRDNLIQRGFEAYLDKHDIAPGEPWQERLSGLITSSDTVLFCLSPHFVTSPICDWEVNEAERFGKRLLPVVAAETGDDDIPGRLKRLNFIFMRNEAETAEGLKQVVTALETDIDWIREHTRLGELAMRWHTAENMKVSPLQGDELVAAERWLDDKPPKAPDPTDLHKDYIRESRQSETARLKRQRRNSRIITFGSLTAVIVMGVLGWLMYGQWMEGLRSQSIYLADLAQKEIKEGDAVTGALLALEALQDQGKDSSFTAKIRPLSPQSQNALDSAYQPSLWHDHIFQRHDVDVLLAIFSPDGKKILIVSDDNTARLWDAKTNEELGVFKHKAKIFSAVFSPDSSIILTTSVDHTANLWDVKNGRHIAILKLKDNASSASFSFDSMRIITTTLQESSVQLWDAKTGEKILKMEGNKDECEILSAVFSPNSNHILITCTDATARIWDAKTGQELVQFKKHKSEVLFGVFSPDGTRIFTSSSDWHGAEGSARLWDAKTGQQLAKLDTYGVIEAIFSPDGDAILTSTRNKEIQLWDAKTGQQSTVIKGYEGGVNQVTFSPDGMSILTASEDGTSRLWDTLNGRQLAILKGGENSIISAVFSSDGKKIITVSKDGIATEWENNNHPYSTILNTLEETGIIAIFSPNSIYALTKSSNNNTMILWDANTGKQLTTLKSKFNNVFAVFSPDSSHILTYSQWGKMILWDAKSGKKLVIFNNDDDQPGELLSATFSSNGSHILSVFKKDTLMDTNIEKSASVWDAQTGRQLFEFKPNSGLRSAIFSPTGKYILTTFDNDTAQMLEVGTGKQVYKFAHKKNLISPIFSPDGRSILSTSADNTVRLRDVKTGKQIMVLSHGDKVLSSIFSPDSTLIFTVFDNNRGQLWEAKTGKQIISLEYDFKILSGMISQDNSQILTASNNDISQLWEVKSGKLIAELKHNGDELLNKPFSIFPLNDTHIIITSGSKTIRLWERKAGQQIAVLRQKDQVKVATASPDGMHILTISQYGSIQLWKIPPPIQEQIDQVKKQITRCLTSEQRKQFHLSDEPPFWCYTMQKYPYDDDLPQAGWAEQNLTALRSTLASWSSQDSWIAKTLNQRNWLFSPYELLNLGHAKLKQKSYKQALSFYQRAKARAPQNLKANVQPHIEAAKAAIAKMATAN